jgi:predicted lipoprotein with Yx(FWY)xxD motif
MQLARPALALAATLGAALALSAGAMAAHAAPTAATASAARAPIAAPVVKMKSNLGLVVATKKKLGLYTWDQEKDFKVRCTGSCATAWPPVLLMKGDKVKAMTAGIQGEFGTITRPDGATQLTWNKQPVYTYRGDRPGFVGCDNVDGWHAVKVM